MLDEAEQAALVLLLRDARGRWRGLTEQLERLGSVLLAFELRDGGQTDLLREAELQEATREVRSWRSDGIALVSVLDAEYPAHLRELQSRPPALFVRGSLLGLPRAVAVIGSRRASEEGEETARRLGRLLAGCGVTVISGLAAGIDAAAHRGALTAAGPDPHAAPPTVAVVGTGLRRSYPPQHAALQEEIGRRGGVISQFWPTAPPDRRNFPQRNALMAGLSQATVIVEAGAASGAQIQAQVALRAGRPVVIREGVLAHAWARELGPSALLHPFTGAEEAVALIEQLTGTEAGMRQQGELPAGPTKARESTR